MDISNITSIVSAGGVIVSIIYLAKQIKSTNTIHSQNHEWNRRIETKKILDQYNQLESVERLEEIFKFSDAKHPIPMDKIEEKIEKEKLLKLTIRRLLNFYEGLCNGIDMRIYNEAMVKETRRGHMIRTFIAFNYFIEALRRERNNNKLYIKFEKYVKKWIEEEKNDLVLNQLGTI